MRAGAEIRAAGCAVLALAVQIAVLGTAPASAQGGATSSGPIAVSADGGQLLVVNPDSGSVTVLALPGLEVVGEIPVGRTPETLSPTPDGRFVYVTSSADDTVWAIDMSTLTPTVAVPVGDAPFGVLAGPDGRVFVTGGGADTLQVLAAETLEPLAKTSTERQPRALALSPDGTTLYVTHFLSGRLSVFDALSLELMETVSTGPDANLMQGLAVGPGDRLYLPHTRSNAANRALVFDATVFPAVAVIDLQTLRPLRPRSIALDIADRPVGLPIAAAVLPERRLLYVVNAASNDVSVIDLGTRKAVAHIEVGANPRGIALSPDGAFAYVSNALSGSVSVIDTTLQTVVDEVVVTEIPLPGAVLDGKRLFNSSARTDLARDRWIACATCHFDGGMDARTWFFRDGPRNTPSLAGAYETLPLHWSGDLDEMQDVESTIRNIQAGTGLALGPDNCAPACDRAAANSGRSAALDNLAAYLQTLEPPASPHIGTDSELSGAVARGRSVFMSAEVGCAACHPAGLFTDRKAHNVGTGESPLEAKGQEFDTPSLRGVRLTAPYLHDGRAPTLMDVFVSNSQNLHGRTGHLGAAELAALIAYLNWL